MGVFLKTENFHGMKILPFSLFLLFLPCMLQGQLERSVDFSTQGNGRVLRFVPQVPPLQQMAGAPPAYWKYYWEFGDGTFSFEESPRHVYPAPGEYQALLAATAVYDHGKPPKEKPKKVRASAGAWAADFSYPHVLKRSGDAIGLQAVRNPRAEETFILIISYHNPTGRTIDGQIALRYNETAFGYDLFTFKEARTHYGETPAAGLSLLLPESFASDAQAYASAAEGLLPSGKWSPYIVQMYLPKGSENQYGMAAEMTAASAKPVFGNAEGWYFQNLAPGETRNLFVSLDASPQMLQDTNVVINFQAQIQDASGQLNETADLAISIVSSHDPNYLAVDKRRRSYRRVRKEKFKYEVHFQNEGDGPANKIRISVDLPEGLNPESLEVLDFYPDCPICPKGQPPVSSCLDTALYENRVEFVFYNIYLPGTKQAGVSKRDSTRGFVRYVLKPGKKTKKQKMKSRAAIYFDNDAPVITKPASTRFKWGISPALMLSKGILPDSSNQWRLGIVAAPYKPYKPYLQFEIHGGTREAIKNSVVLMDTTTLIVAGQQFELDSIYTTAKNINTQRFSMEFVPAHLRYNLGGVLSMGTGMSIEWAQETHDVFEVRSLTEVCEIYQGVDFFCHTDVNPNTTTSEYRTSSRYFVPALFGELSLGSVRIGPSIGARVYWPLSDKRNFYVSAFGIWRF